ncbi:phage tail tip protein [Vibrio harveyi]|uniref:phage tail tip protein n=1 Tax=Vibrio harveyi TaxID=669 RepID=UPI0025AF51DB|nr:hypothetical protein [Vibrio harveyi]WJT09288.1 hypothetical protein PH545_25000 [Vibrio harveyi]
MATNTLQAKLGGKVRGGKFLAVPKPLASDPTIDAIAENLEQLTGMRGTGGRRAVLWGELEALGIANLNGGNAQLGAGFGTGDTSGGGGGGITPPDVEAPTQPQNVSGYGGFGIAVITWDMPSYVGHSYAEIFQSKDNVFANATRIGTTPADIYTTPIEMDGAYYFWVRFVNVKGDFGPISSTNGLYIASVPDPDYLLGLIRQEIPDLDNYVTADDLSSYAKREALVDFVDVNLLDRLETMLAEASLETNVTINEQVTELKVDGATLRATIQNEYRTAVSTDQAIAAAVQTVKSEIEDPDGSSLAAQIKSQYVTTTTFTKAEAQLRQDLTSGIDGVKSTLTNDYYTSAQTDHAISQSSQTLTSAIDGVSSNLTNNYLTKTKTNEAISQAKNELQSTIDNLDSTLSTTFYTKTKTDEQISQAISQLDTKLQSNIDGLSSSLTTHYYTKSETEGEVTSAVGALETKLSSSIGHAQDAANAAQGTANSVKSDLSNNYYTKTQTNGQITTAVSHSEQTLQSSINGVNSKVSQVASAQASTDGKFEALWGVKASAGDLTASVGLVAKHQGGTDINDAYFYVHNADFQVTYDDGNGNKAVPIFGTVTHEGKKYLAINTASIKVANIQDLVAGDIMATGVVQGATLRGQHLITPTINSVNHPFYVTETGTATMKNATVHGHIDAISGTLDHVTINDTCTIKGKLKANQIDGDIAKAYAVSIPHKTGEKNPFWVYTLNIPSSEYDREVQYPVFAYVSLSSTVEYYLNGSKIHTELTGSLGGLSTPFFTRLSRNRTHKIQAKMIPSAQDLGAGVTIVQSRAAAMAFMN